MSGILKQGRNKFIAGLLVVVPLVATYLALRFVLMGVDGVLGPLLERLLHRHIPGLGLLLTLVLVFIAGIVMSHFLGRRLVGLGESLVGRLPVISSVYKTAKELVEAVATPKSKLFSEFVMIEYPRRGLYAYGYVTSYATREDGDGLLKVANVFVPTTPVPTTGIVIAVPLAELIRLDISSEEAIKIIVSGGFVSPLRLPVQAPESPREDDA